MDNLILVVVFLFISFLFILIGGISWYRTKQFAETANKATGTVIALARRSSSEGSDTYSPVVRFRAIDGSDIEFTESMSSNPAGYEVNERVDILYDPENYRNARVFKSSWRLYFVPLLFGGMGILFLIVDCILLSVFGPGLISEFLK